MKLTPMSYTGGAVTYDERGELISPPEGECDSILAGLRDKAFTELKNR
jgi:hypothetical protein